MKVSRRQLLIAGLLGGGGLGLKSLVSGIPKSILRDPREAMKSSGLSEAMNRRPAQYVVYNTSSQGDPLNANAPGTYLDSRLGHPADPAMAPARFSLADQNVTAAQPWSKLPQPLLDRCCFFHHATYTVLHSDEARIMALGGNMMDGTMYGSFLASCLAPTLDTIQPDPIVLGPRQTSEDFFYGGHPEPIVAPSSLAALLAPPIGNLGKLTRLRDRTVDELNDLVKSEGNPAKTDFVDRYALSQREVRALSEDLLSRLESIQDDQADSQVVAAALLIRMKLAPVISINIPFGGDNHGDPNLRTEVNDTVAGVRTIGRLWDELVSAGIQDQVSFLSLNVFGRTLSAGTSQNGRSHNANHHVALMFGAPFQGGVVGGVEPVEPDFGAMSIDSESGAGIAHGKGDIPLTQTLQSMARTFGVGVGLKGALLAENIKGEGKVVTGALTRAGHGA